LKIDCLPLQGTVTEEIINTKSGRIGLDLKSNCWEIGVLNGSGSSDGTVVSVNIKKFSS